MTKHPEDDDIVHLFKKGGNHTNTAFNQIVAKYGDILYRQIRAITKIMNLLMTFCKMSL